MTRTVALVLLALLIAIGGGAGTLYLALERPIADPGRGWLPYPGNGSSDADPYQRAQIALRGILPLGRSEGLAGGDHEVGGRGLTGQGRPARAEGHVGARGGGAAQDGRDLGRVLRDDEGARGVEEVGGMARVRDAVQRPQADA